MGITAAAPLRGKEVAINSPDDPTLEANLKNPFGILLVVLPSTDRQLYNRVKFIGDVKLGTHTICVVGPKFVKGNEQYNANVALKFNLKLGGINQLVHNTNLSRKEMVTELDSMIASRLSLWKTRGKHASLPESLLIYRDGVSEGQYDIVIDTELPLIRKACADVYPATDTKKGLPKITIIIVGKRHHTRFYPTKEADADRSGNPKNGTCVDRGVTEPRNWDFFIQAHTAIQGTARPAHYYIVLDEIFTKRKVAPPHQNAADVLEDLTHSMCYLFGRATKAVSICPPAYYADIICERARCYLSGLFDMVTPSATPAQSVVGEGVLGEPRAEDVLIHPNLRNTMFYI
jgi:eukaryotic translation initiation factor 2C